MEYPFSKSGIVSHYYIYIEYNPTTSNLWNFMYALFVEM